MASAASLDKTLESEESEDTSVGQYDNPICQPPSHPTEGKGSPTYRLTSATVAKEADVTAGSNGLDASTEVSAAHPPQINYRVRVYGETKEQLVHPLHLKPCLHPDNPNLDKAMDVPPEDQSTWKDDAADIEIQQQVQEALKLAQQQLLYDLQKLVNDQLRNSNWRDS